MSKYSQHTEWLSLVEVSGPFLAIPVLEDRFPAGLDGVDAAIKRRIRDLYDYRCDQIDENHPDAIELNRGWVHIVLEELLEFGDQILLPVENSDHSEFIYTSPDGNGTFAPDLVLRSEAGQPPFLLISILPPGTDLEKVKAGDRWPVSIIDRMKLLCRSINVRLGLVTNGERWTLVNAPAGSTSGHTSWYARLWFQEPVTLQAFKSLLETRRWFGPDDETLPAMLEASLEHHEEVTDTLGEQVRRAVEVLVQCLDKADQDRNRELLHDVDPAELYEAGLTVMMRLVFILCAEERGLLLLGYTTYDNCYAISTLRDQLAEKSHRHGPEVLERHHDAWSRLLAVFRAIYGGIDQEDLHMPALGGSLFDPDRFPFIEGRVKGTNWRESQAQPLPIDNRTVLLLLEALQVLEQRGGALLLSYKALDVEQIGHVYEGLLEHTVRRLPDDALGLKGSKNAKNQNISLAELESAYLDGIDEAANLIKSKTLRGLPAIKKALNKEADEETYGKILSICGGDTELGDRIRPFSHLLRTDAWGDFIIYRQGSLSVTLGADRRETGTHYTPKSLTESIVETTLQPLAYIGPVEGKPRDEWQLKSAAELLDLKVCDPAMGSGAFLVQVCRWLSERLVEAWCKEADQGNFITVDGVAIENSDGAEPMPDSLDERLLIARRLVAEKCLYGVDLNPLAVELAKLSIWLITLSKDRPFGFLDHNLRSGDSLLGLHKLDQLTKFALHPEKKQTISIFASNIEAAVRDALVLRKQLRKTTIRDIRDVQYMERLDQQVRQKLEHIEHIADAMVGQVLASGGNQRALDIAMDNFSTWAAAYIEGDNETGRKIIAEARKSLAIDLPAGKPPRKPFHWALEFPEVFERGGFDGVVGNPPFLGRRNLVNSLGRIYRSILAYLWPHAPQGADLCAFFYLRCFIHLVAKNGCTGLLATNSLSQGATREASLKYICNKGGVIYNSFLSLKWPGRASVYVSISYLFKGEYRGDVFLNDKRVTHITSQLTEGSPIVLFKLKRNERLSFQGVIPLSDKFQISNRAASGFVAKNYRNAEVIFPFYNARALYSRHDLKHIECIINFGSRSLEEIKEYADVYQYSLKHVFPDRQKSKNENARVYWWQYWRPRPELLKATKGKRRILATAFTSNTFAFVFVPTNSVYSNALVLFAFDSYAAFALLQSSFHYVWSIQNGSTMKLDLRYTPTSCFQTFPLAYKSLDHIGEKYYKLRDSIMNQNKEGLTNTYNRVNDPKEQSDSIQELRTLYRDMDQAVANAFNWHDLDLCHGFYETKQGIRFTISEEARREVLERLLKLNHERYEEEVEIGLHDKKKSKKTTTSRKKKVISAKDTNQLRLLDD